MPTLGKWIVCDYFQDVAADEHGQTVRLSLLDVGEQDFTAIETRRSPKSWGGRHRKAITHPIQRALKTGSSEEGVVEYDGERYGYEVVLSRDSGGEIAGVLAIHFREGDSIPPMPRHGALRLHLWRETGEPVDPNERHWTQETLRASGLVESQVRAQTTETRYWLENMLHPADRDQIDTQIRLGARQANGARQYLSYRSTSDIRSANRRRFRPCALTAYGVPLDEDPSIARIRGFWRQRQSPSRTRVTGLNELDDAAILPGTHAAVASFLLYVYVHADDARILRTSINWAAWGFPPVPTLTTFLDLVVPDDRAALRAMMTVALTDSVPSFPIRLINNQTLIAYMVAGVNGHDRVLTLALRREDDAAPR